MDKLVRLPLSDVLPTSNSLRGKRRSKKIRKNLAHLRRQSEVSTPSPGPHRANPENLVDSPPLFVQDELPGLTPRRKKRRAKKNALRTKTAGEPIINKLPEGRAPMLNNLPEGRVPILNKLPESAPRRPKCHTQKRASFPALTPTGWGILFSLLVALACLHMALSEIPVGRASGQLLAAKAPLASPLRIESMTIRDDSMHAQVTGSQPPVTIPSATLPTPATVQMTEVQPPIAPVPSAAPQIPVAEVQAPVAAVPNPTPQAPAPAQITETQAPLSPVVGATPQIPVAEVPASVAAAPSAAPSTPAPPAQIVQSQPPMAETSSPAATLLSATPPTPAPAPRSETQPAIASVPGTEAQTPALAQFTDSQPPPVVIVSTAAPQTPATPPMVEAQPPTPAPSVTPAPVADAPSPATAIPSATPPIPTPALAPPPEPQPAIASVPSIAAPTPAMAQSTESQPPVATIPTTAPQTPVAPAPPASANAEVAVNKDKNGPIPSAAPVRLSDLDTPGQVALGLDPAPDKPVADNSVNTTVAPTVPADHKPAAHPRRSRQQVATSTPPPAKAKPVAPKPVATSLDEPTAFVSETSQLEDKTSRPHFIFNN